MPVLCCAVWKVSGESEVGKRGSVQTGTFAWRRQGAGEHPSGVGLGWRWWSTAAEMSAFVMMMVQPRRDKVTRAEFRTELRRWIRAAGVHAKVTFQPLAQLKYQPWGSSPFPAVGAVPSIDVTPSSCLHVKKFQVFSQMFAREAQKVLMIAAGDGQMSTYCLWWTNQALFDSIQIIIMHTCARVSSLNIHQR